MNKKDNINENELFIIRKNKLDDIKNHNGNPYENNWKPNYTAQTAINNFDNIVEKNIEIFLAGRIKIFRIMGQSIFLKIEDRSGIMQLYIKKDIVTDKEFENIQKLDIGDFIGVQGFLFKTKTGEITLRLIKYKLLSKSLRPLPEKWKGLVNKEQIYRKRYLDLIINQKSKERFMIRSNIIKTIRNFFWERDFIEVETPFLQHKTGGASAKPFITYMDSIKNSFKLRISLELFLKKMLVSGFERVFEIGKVFRNEGISNQHSPEFTMLEAYEAYSDYKEMMKLIYDLIQKICINILGTTKIVNNTNTIIELGGNWKEISYIQLIEEATKEKNWFSLSKEKIIKISEYMGLIVDKSLTSIEITNHIFEKIIQPTLIQPTFVTHIPKELCPLAKINKENNKVLDVFELCINGQEIAPAYSEQNDPIIQKIILEKQNNDYSEIDYDFIEALEYGMPPAGGIGLGIDRLVALFTGVDNLKDIILFPIVKKD